MAKQTLTVKLDPTPEQASQLLATLTTFNAACNHLAGIASTLRCTSRFRLQKEAYRATRSTVRRSQRATFSSWAFRELRAFITYKAAIAGVPVILVDPKNTSRTCPACGHVDKANRKSQAHFCCVSCGCAGHADYFAALEIQRRAAVSQPVTSR